MKKILAVAIALSMLTGVGLLPVTEALAQATPAAPSAQAEPAKKAKEKVSKKKSDEKKSKRAKEKANNGSKKVEKK